MTENTTLADSLFREFSRSKHNRLGLRPFLRSILDARKFVLDDEMSAFMTDLAYAPIVNSMRGSIVNASKSYRRIDEIRALARLPHKITWIEFNLRARMQRAVDEYGQKYLDPKLAPRYCGWLIMEHPQIETAFMATPCYSDSLPSGAGDAHNSVLGTALNPLLEGRPIPSIHSYGWRSDDGPLPWRRIPNQPANPERWLTGVPGYENDSVCLVDGVYGKEVSRLNEKKHDLDEELSETASDLRYLWALLATINDLPTSGELVRPSKGFVARGKYRRYLEHTIIHLQVPKRKTLRTLAAQTIVASRRRAHQVRGHWRDDWRNPGDRIWIREHQRGDAALGFVMHDYVVEKNTEERT